MLKPTTLDLHRGEFESKQMVGSLDVKKITHDLIPFAFILTLILMTMKVRHENKVNAQSKERGHR